MKTKDGVFIGLVSGVWGLTIGMSIADMLTHDENQALDIADSPLVADVKKLVPKANTFWVTKDNIATFEDKGNGRCRVSFNRLPNTPLTEATLALGSNGKPALLECSGEPVAVGRVVGD